MIYKTFEEWKAGQWLEDGEPRTKAYTEDELLLIEMGWQYGFDAGKETNQLTDVIRYQWLRKEFANGRETYLAEGIPSEDNLDRYIDEQLRKAQEK
jgi:hypothetical protein